MNKRHTGKLLAFLLAVVFMFTLVPQVMAAGGDISQWAYIHDTDGNSGDNNNDDAYTPDVWDELGKLVSKITVNDPGGTQISPDGTGKYEVPVNSELELVIAFHLDNRHAPNQNYEVGAYFEYTLPEGLNFHDAGNNLIVDKDDDSFATWTIEGNTLIVTLIKDLKQVSDIWGEIEIDGTFTWKDSGGGDLDQTNMTLGTDSFTFSRQVPEEPSEAVSKSELTKSVEPDISNGKLKWTIGISPQVGATGIDYRGHELVDKLSGPHSFIANSFDIKDGNNAPISGGEVLYVAGTKVLTYKFPADPEAQNPIEGPLTITYETEVSWNGLNRTSPTVFKNGASLKDKKGFGTHEVFAQYEMSMFFHKTLANESAIEYSEDGRVAYLRWEIDVTLPAEPGGFVFPNARIIDRIFTGNGTQEFLNNSQYPVKIKYPNTSGVYDNWPEVGDGSNGAIEEEAFTENNKAGTQITYTFADGHPKIIANANAVYTLSYYTQVSLDAGVNDQVDAQNKAWFEWWWNSGEGPGTGNEPWHIGEVSVTKNIAEKHGLLDKQPDISSNDYDHSKPQGNTQSDYIKWTIVVNERRIDLKNSQLVLTDEVLELQDHEFILSENQGLEIKITPHVAGAVQNISFTGVGTEEGFILTQVGNGFRLEFPQQPGRNKYEISFYSRITDSKRESMYRNATSDKDRIPFNNKAVLQVTEGGSTIPLDVTATKYYRLRMLDKSAGSFDYEDRTLTYTLDVNRNRLPLPGGTIIKEVLPNGLVLHPDPAENNGSPFKVKITSANTTTSYASLEGTGIVYDEMTNGFKLTIPATGDYAVGGPNLDIVGDYFEITYTTRLTDDFLKVTTNPLTETLTNKVTLRIADKEPIEDSTDTPIIYKTLDKQPDNYEGGDTVDWSISINPGQVDLGENVWIKDKLPKELKLVGDIKLYKANVNPGNGSLSKASGNPENLEPEPSYDESENELSLKLPSGQQAYILEFSTFVKEDNVNFTNTIRLLGFASDGGIVEGTSDEVNVTNRYSSGGIGTYVLQVRKLDEKGAPMPEVTFQLLTQDGSVLKRNDEPYEVKTNDQGIAKFMKLPYWAFSVRETVPPTGYLSAGLKGPVRPSAVADNSEEQPVNIEIQNFPALENIEFQKINNDEEPLDGGQFELYAYSDGVVGDRVAGPIAAELGSIIFTDIPLGEYVIKEEVAPPGYLKTEVLFRVVVGYDNDKTATKVTFYPEEDSNGEGEFVLINEYAGKITVIKTGASGPLSGVTFQLYAKQEGSTEPVLLEGKSETTATNGVVVFDELPLGTYYVKETAAPSGYHLNTTLHEVVLTDGADPELGNDDEPIKGWEKTLELRNYLLTDSVILTKTDPNGVALDGGWFGIFSNEEATGDPLDKVQADGGQIVFSGLLPGNYYVRELEAPAGYIKSDKIIKVGVSVSGNSIAGEVVKEPLVNTWAGGIKLVKVDEKGEPLAGAVFELLDANKKVIKEGTSGKDGVIEFKELAMGTYYLREKTAPAGYAKLMELTEVVLKAGAEADMVKTVKLANHRNLASVTLRKTNQYDGLVSGGLFGIYKTDDAGFKNPLQKVPSVKGIITFTDLEAGQYFIREIEAPKEHKLTGEFVKVVLEVNPDTGFLEDVEIEKPLLNETHMTEEEWDEFVKGEEDEKENGGKDDDLVETGGFLDTAMLWFFGTLLILAGAILLLRMRAALVRK